MPIRESSKEESNQRDWKEVDRDGSGWIGMDRDGSGWIGMDRDGSRKLEPIQAKGSPAAVAMNQTKE